MAPSCSSLARRCRSCSASYLLYGWLTAAGDLGRDGWLRPEWLGVRRDGGVCHVALLIGERG